MTQRKRYLICLLLITLTVRVPLVALVLEASYVPESPLYFELAPGIFSDLSVIGTKLGTFIITSDGPFYNPSFLNTSEVGNGITMTGLYKDWEGGAYTTRTYLPFKVLSVSYPSGYGGSPVIETLYGDKWPMIEQNNQWNGVTISTNPFYVEIYLVNTNSDKGRRYDASLPANLGTDGRFFKIDTPYTINGSFNPYFSIGVAVSPEIGVGTYANGANSTITDPSEGAYVSVEGISGPDSTPILNPNAFTVPGDPGTPGFYYGDEPVLPTFNFNFHTQQASFLLESAIGSQRTVVNQVKIEVLNGVSGTYYAQVLTFNDNSPAYPEFLLLPLDGQGLPISYQLFLDAQPITKGTPYTWENLTTYGCNTKDLIIGEISQTEVDSRASGTYRGTITVTITTPD